MEMSADICGGRKPGGGHLPGPPSGPCLPHTLITLAELMVLAWLAWLMLTDRRELPFRVIVTSCVTEANKLPRKRPGKLYRPVSVNEDTTAALAGVPQLQLARLNGRFIPARTDVTCFSSLSFVPPPPYVEELFLQYVGGSYLTFPAS